MGYTLKKVDKLVYRSRCPYTWAEIAQVQAAGIRTIINLQDRAFFSKRSIYYGHEAQLLNEYGIQVIYLPLHYLKVPRLEELEQVFTHLSQTQTKVLIHCQHGVDRTGMAIAYWKIKREMLTLEDSVTEMIEHGFHVRWLSWWIPYLKKYLFNSKS